MNRLAVVLLLAFICAKISKIKGSPNVIVIMADDLGYGDLYTYDSSKNQDWTPIDDMAKEGVKFNQWTAGGPMCSPSRTTVLTGRYAFRSGIYGMNSQVFAPSSMGGLPTSTVTVAEGLQTLNYTTGMIGKWHLGINAVTQNDGVNLPIHHGFDWVGTNLPHGQSSSCDPTTNTVDEMTKQCFLYNGSTIVQQPINVGKLSEKLRDDAITFINANKDNNFFLYLALPQVHPALFCNSQFCNTSSRDSDGYGDTILEMAWIVEGVLDELKALSIDDDTLVIFTSDQGASQDNCRSVHYNGGFRGGKGSTWEGAYRVPAIAWWPGTLTANTESNTLVNHLDIFPTILTLAGGSDYLNGLTDALDGMPIPDFVPAAPERESFFYYCSDRLMAVRYKNYKVHYHTMGSATPPSGNCNSNNGDFGCYGSDIVSHTDPVVFDLSTPDGLSETTQYAGADKNTIISEVEVLISAHSTSKPASEIDKGRKTRLLSCCNPTGSTCECNYP